MPFVFEGLEAVAITLAVIYTILSAVTYRQLLWLQANTPTGLNTRKLFVMTILLTSILRVMSFGSMAALNFYDVQVNKDKSNQSNPDSSVTQKFFEEAFLVLFDLPDFCYISAYVLLIVVWAETYLKSRRHWLSSYKFRRMWMLSYFVFNIVLYTVQLVVYSMLFIPNMSRTVEAEIVYITLATFNIGLPICFMFVTLYIAFQFAGFPFSSMENKLRLQSLSRVAWLWTASRLGWGLIALTSVAQGWIDTVHGTSRVFYSIVLISIFVLVEVIPIVFSLQARVLNSLSENASIIATAPRSGYGTGEAPNDPLLPTHTRRYVMQPDGSKASVTVGPSSLLGSSGGTRHRRAPSLDEDDYELEREHRPVPQHLPIGRIEAGSKAGIGQYPHHRISYDEDDYECIGDRRYVLQEEGVVSPMHDTSTPSQVSETKIVFPAMGALYSATDISNGKSGVGVGVSGSGNEVLKSSNSSLVNSRQVVEPQLLAPTPHRQHTRNPSSDSSNHVLSRTSEKRQQQRSQRRSNTVTSGGSGGSDLSGSRERGWSYRSSEQAAGSLGSSDNSSGFHTADGSEIFFRAASAAIRAQDLTSPDYTILSDDDRDEEGDEDRDNDGHKDRDGDGDGGKHRESVVGNGINRNGVGGVVDEVAQKNTDGHVREEAPDAWFQSNEAAPSSWGSWW